MVPIGGELRDSLAHDHELVGIWEGERPSWETAPGRDMLELRRRRQISDDKLQISDFRLTAGETRMRKHPLLL